MNAAAAVAAELDGVVSRVSAAVTWGWDVPSLPFLPQITVRRNRRLRPRQRELAHVRRMDLAADQIAGVVTAPGRTLIDCLRWLPLPDGICVGDSALRNGFPRADLSELAARAKGPRSVRVRRAAFQADRRAANVFESRLRTICLSVRGLAVVPQVSLVGDSGLLGMPDLVDADLRMVIEADSFEWHGYRAALAEDARRYNGFAAEGWLVLRFSWEDVMLEPERVRETLLAAVATAAARLERSAG